MSHLRNILPKPRSWTFSPMFSYGSFIVLGFMFRSMIHLKVIFMYGIRYGLKFILVCVWTLSCFSTVWWKDYPFSIELLLLLCQKSIVFICLWVCFWTLNSVPLMYFLFPFMPTPYCPNYCSFMISLDIPEC